MLEVEFSDRLFDGRVDVSGVEDPEGVLVDVPESGNVGIGVGVEGCNLFDPSDEGLNGTEGKACGIVVDYLVPLSIFLVVNGNGGRCAIGKEDVLGGGNG